MPYTVEIVPTNSCCAGVLQPRRRQSAVLDAGVHHQEVANELCYLRPGLDTTASPDADD